MRTQPVSKYPIDATLAALWPHAHIPPRSSGHSKLCCPAHSDTVASASIDWDKERFHCFGCETSGDAIDLIMSEQEVSFGAAKSWAEAEIGQGRTSLPGPAKRRRTGLF